MKNCISCCKRLPLSAFYKHPQMADGRLNKCKECVKEYQRSRPMNIEYERARALLPHRVAARVSYAQTVAGKEAAKRAHRKSLEMFPKKHTARNKVSNALRDGKIKKPGECSVCGETGRIHGHHDDYDHPLDVRWLCTACHRQWHMANGPGQNGGD